VVGRENVIAGVDCGFGTFAGRVQVDTKIVWLKLQSLAEGARHASAQLWAKAA
jgi:5-methyltetrahydropteroyltriglutamate--homocysteine methyltransferase